MLELKDTSASIVLGSKAWAVGPTQTSWTRCSGPKDCGDLREKNPQQEISTTPHPGHHGSTVTTGPTFWATAGFWVPLLQPRSWSRQQRSPGILRVSRTSLIRDYSRLLSVSFCDLRLCTSIQSVDPVSSTFSSAPPTSIQISQTLKLPGELH